MHSFSFNFAPAIFENTRIKNGGDTYYVLWNQEFFRKLKVHIELFSKFPIYTLPLKWNILEDHRRYQYKGIKFKIALTDYLLRYLVDS
jgi:hypothetical protein